MYHHNKYINQLLTQNLVDINSEHQTTPLKIKHRENHNTFHTISILLEETSKKKHSLDAHHSRTTIINMVAIKIIFLQKEERDTEVIMAYASFKCNKYKVSSSKTIATDTALIATIGQQRVFL